MCYITKMLDLKSFQSAMEQLEIERGVSKEQIIETIEMALSAAYKRDYGKKGQIIQARLDPMTGSLSFSQIKIVVDESMLKSDKEPDEEETKAEEEKEEEKTEEKKIRFNPERHIMIEEARKIKKNVKLEEELMFPLEIQDDYGRIAAQTAKQVIIQRIREAERESIFEEYKSRQGEIVSGIIQRVENYNIFLDLGRTTATLPKEEQVAGERYRIGERIKAIIYLVERTPKGTTISLSRSHPKFVTKLFEIEVPEITNKVVEIKAISREAGSRSKIAVFSNEEGIDPVGSCVGQKGVRVNTVISELGGEKIDIIEWSGDPEVLVANSLSPAKILDVETNLKTKEAKVIAEKNQLSLAIGKNGQNVRLAAKLTGWKIDIKSQSGETVAQATEEGKVTGEGIAKN